MSALLHLRREPDVGHYASRAGLRGEVLGLGESSTGVFKAGISNLSESVGVGRGLGQGVTDDHTETGLEGRDLGRLLVVGQAVLHVVYGHTTLGSLEAHIRNNGHALKCAVSSSEEEHCGPVVG